MIASALRQLTVDSRWKIIDEVNPRVDLKHTQGMVFDGSRYWISSVDEIRKEGWLYILTDEFEFIDKLLIGSGTSYHPGGLSISDDAIWVPVAPYEPSGPTLIERVSIIGAASETVFQIDDHIGAVCYLPDDTVFGANWGSRNYGAWDVDGNSLSLRTNPSHFLDWQDTQLVEDSTIACGGRIRLRARGWDRDCWLGGIALISSITLEIEHEVPIVAYNKSGLPAMAEGFTLAMSDGTLLVTVCPDGGFEPITTWALTT